VTLLGEVGVQSSLRHAADAPAISTTGRAMSFWKLMTLLQRRSVGSGLQPVVSSAIATATRLAVRGDGTTTHSSEDMSLSRQGMPKNGGLGQ